MKRRLALLLAVVMVFNMAYIAGGIEVAAESAAPIVVSTQPGNGETVPMADAFLTLAFDQEMDASTVTNVSNYTSNVPISKVAYDAATKTASIYFSPVHLKRGTQVTVSPKTSILSADGTPLSLEGVPAVNLLKNGDAEGAFNGEFFTDNAIITVIPDPDDENNHVYNVASRAGKNWTYFRRPSPLRRALPIGSNSISRSRARMTVPRLRRRVLASTSISGTTTA